MILVPRQQGHKVDIGLPTDGVCKMEMLIFIGRHEVRTGGKRDGISHRSEMWNVQKRHLLLLRFVRRKSISMLFRLQLRRRDWDRHRCEGNGKWANGRMEYMVSIACRAWQKRIPLMANKRMYALCDVRRAQTAAPTLSYAYYFCSVCSASGSSFAYNFTI